MEKTIAAILDTEMTCSDAAVLYDVPRSTLQRKVKLAKKINDVKKAASKSIMIFIYCLCIFFFILYM